MRVVHSTSINIILKSKLELLILITMSAYAVHTENLWKIYNENKKNQVEAVKNLNLRIKKGEIYGLLGENGAGKTTTVRILTTMIKATSGAARILGNDVISDSSNVRQSVGCLPQESGLYEEFSAVENLNYIAKLRNMEKTKRKEQIKEYLSLVGLTQRKNDRVETYSGGMKQRLMIARALMGNPEVLFLDEPTAGIDVLVVRRIRELIKTFSEQKNITVILSTHDIYTAERLCDRVGVLHRGELVAEGTPAELIQNYAAEGQNNDLEDAVVKLIGWTGDQEDD